MAQVMIYVFEEPRYHKTKAASAFPFNYDNAAELERQLFIHLEREKVYHVTAFNTYGQLIMELFRSDRQKWKKNDN
jgi:hypothetical protein